jgi:hypothetical protein
VCECIDHDFHLVPLYASRPACAPLLLVKHLQEALSSPPRLAHNLCPPLPREGARQLSAALTQLVSVEGCASDRVAAREERLCVGRGGAREIVPREDGPDCAGLSEYGISSWQRWTS